VSFLHATLPALRPSYGTDHEHEPCLTRCAEAIAATSDGYASEKRLFVSTQEIDVHDRIPVYQPDLSGKELDYVTECLHSTWISSKGVFIGRFEQEFRDFVGAGFAGSVSNGTVALHLALEALGIGPGDEVIVPTLTYIASANAVSYTGAVPVFVDSEADGWQIDLADIRRKMTPRTRAIMPVHLYGAACDMDGLMALAAEHGLFVVEDCAEAIGTMYKGRHVGSFGTISTFSFFGNKTITTGEGGMVVTNDQTLYERAVHLKGQGLAAHRQYWHDVIGYNYRMTNICAAIGCAQMERAAAFLADKKRVADGYRSRLADVPVVFQQEAADTVHSHWMISLLCRHGDDRDPLRAALEAANIETRPVFFPVHTMPMYAKRFESHPVAEDIGRRGISVPSWPGLGEDDLDYICDVIRAFYAERPAP
jgi:perosamine synthetase